MYPDKRRKVSDPSVSVSVHPKGDPPSGEQLRIDLSLRCIREYAHVLCTPSGVLPQLTNIQHVGLHNLRLQPQLITELSHVLVSLPPSVTALSLSTAISENELNPRQRGILFSSIALVKSLRELHMPDWREIVGEDVSCLEPLYHLPHLDVVHVTRIRQSASFPAELNFKDRSQ
jgi:hypothetical protein